MIMVVDVASMFILSMSTKLTQQKVHAFCDWNWLYNLFMGLPGKSKSVEVAFKGYIHPWFPSVFCFQVPGHGVTSTTCVLNALPSTRDDGLSFL